MIDHPGTFLHSPARADGNRPPGTALSGNPGQTNTINYSAQLPLAQGVKFDF
ncbi:MAG: hypothetical protein WBB85_18975 [Albidovulum sp.]|uniref:hypothetical protein n=1 Tax=Albidovulum sp. TaxID=1872424 RepID=UPI003C82EDAB